MEPGDETIEGMAAVVRRIVARELAEMDKALFLNDESVDRLSKLALVLQRIRMPTAKEPSANGESGAEGMPNEKLMRKAAE